MKLSWVVSFLCGFLLASVLGVIVLFTFQYKKYYEYDSVIEKRLIINPFQMDEDNFEGFYTGMKYHLAESDSSSAISCAKEMLLYRGSYNEKQRGNLFSDMNLAWQHIIKKDLKYSEAYELLGKIDSAMSCLKRALKATEKDFNFHQVDKRFFYLMTKKLGKAKTISLLEKSLQNIEKSNKEMPYCEFIYKMEGFEIGISKAHYDSLKTDKTFITRELYDIYGLASANKQ